MDYDQQIETLSNKLVEGFLQTIDILSALLGAEERYYMGSHCRFVSEKSEEIARYMGMSESDIFEIKTAGLLHDIGKIGFPDTLLAKFPPEMTPEEFRFYVRHCELGREVLRRHSYLASIAEIVYQHHERLDGSGFPRHLRGDAIHTGAMIIGVVDVYHNAMYRRTKDRYQSAETSGGVANVNSFLDETKNRFGQVMNHLQRKSGTLYRPDIVDAFTTIVEVTRKKLGERVIKRYVVNQLKPGMTLVDNYYTSYGLLVAARDETLTERMISSLIRFAELGEIPQKVLVID